MADKLSSPSSNSDKSNQATPPKSSQGRRSEISILLLRQPPLYLFPNEDFEFKVGLEVAKNVCDSPPDNVEIVASLSSAGVNTAEPTLWIDEYKTKMPLRVSTSKPCTIRCRIQTSPQQVRRDKRASYRISISPRENGRGIASAQTVPLQLVNYKLNLSTDAHWSNVWYKDEGGRDKCMEVVAELTDKDKRRHKEKIPLKLTLCYVATTDSISAGLPPVSVTNQDILRMLGSASKMQTDKSTGATTVRFRIEDVSKNHQGQDFVVQVSPDNRKGFWDVGPGYTPAVSVRSKRNKRQRTVSLRSGGPERRQSPTANATMAFGGLEHEQQRASIGGAFDGSDIGRLREAMKGVVNWTEEVVNGLYPLQWQIVGYAPHPDGSPDYNHPYHNMPNPNACISRLLSMYTESTREHLWVLTQAVENASPVGLRGESPYGGGGMEHREEEAYGPPIPHGGSMHPPPPVHAGQAGLVVPPPPTTVTRVQGGMHPSIASEAFRKPPPTDHPPQHPAAMHFPPPSRQHSQQQQQQQQLPQQLAQQYYQHPPAAPPPLHPHVVGRRSSLDEAEGAPYGSIPQRHRHATAVAGASAGRPTPSDRGDEKQQSLKRYDEQGEENRESEVEYVLAKQYKALRTGERLGFPAYSATREILGFYPAHSNKVGLGQFVPISRHTDDFGPLEFMQASDILQDAINNKSRAVHALKDWGSINNLIDHVLVYDWSKDIGSEGGQPPRSDED